MKKRELFRIKHASMEHSYIVADSMATAISEAAEAGWHVISIESMGEVSVCPDRSW